MLTKIAKLWIRVSFLLLIVFVLLFIGLHIFVNAKGKVLLTEKLQEVFKQKVKIGSLSTSFPINVSVKDIEVEGLFKIDEVFAGGGLFDIFNNSFNLSLLKLTHPVVNIERNFAKSTAEAFVPSAANLQGKIDNSVTGNDKTVQPNLNPLALPQNRFLSPSFSIRHLIIYDGVFNFNDKSIGKEGIIVTMEYVNAKIDNLNFFNAVDQITSFELNGRLPWRQGEQVGAIELKGWLNFLKKDMQATLKLTDIDAIYLYPYYSNWVDLEKARIERAKLGFTSEIQGLNNDVTANCHLELTDIVFTPRAPEEGAEKAEKIAAAVLDIFKALNQGKIVLNFTIKTKMDRPQFGFGDIKSAFETKLAEARKQDALKPEDVLALPVRVLQGTVKGATDITKALVIGTASVGNELKKALEAAFKREGNK